MDYWRNYKVRDQTKYIFLKRDENEEYQCLIVVAENRRLTYDLFTTSFLLVLVATV